MVETATSKVAARVAKEAELAQAVDEENEARALAVQLCKKYLAEAEARYLELVGIVASLPRKPNSHSVDERDAKRTSIVARDDDLGDKLATFYDDTLDGAFLRCGYY